MTDIPLRKDAEFSERDVVFAVGLASGVPIKELAELANLSERSVYTHLDASEGNIGRIRSLVAPLVKVSRRELREIAADKADQELESLLGAGVDAFRDALASGDVKLALEAAEKLFNRVKGRPSSTLNVNQSGRIDHLHAHFTVPNDVAQGLVRDARADAALHGRANQLRQGEVTVMDA